MQFIFNGIQLKGEKVLFQQTENRKRRWIFHMFFLSLFNFKQMKAGCIAKVFISFYRRHAIAGVSTKKCWNQHLVMAKIWMGFCGSLAGSSFVNSPRTRNFLFDC